MIISVGNKVRHENYGLGTVMKMDEFTYTIDFGARGTIDVSARNNDLLKVVESSPEIQDREVSVSDIEELLINILDKYNGINEVVPLGEKWIGGTIILQPGNSSLKPKELPIETFFHKIVMLRDRLRVLEQNINSNTKLNDEEKINMQQYITRIYGSLTTFNVLFKNPDHNFVGSSSKD
jgi:hypothetical protein